MIYTNDGEEVVMVKREDLIYLVGKAIMNTDNKKFICQVAEDFVVSEEDINREW